MRIIIVQHIYIIHNHYGYITLHHLYTIIITISIYVQIIIYIHCAMHKTPEPDFKVTINFKAKVFD